MNCQVPYHIKGEFQLMMKISFHDSHRTFGRAGPTHSKRLGKVPINQTSSSFFTYHYISSAYVAMENVGYVVCQTMSYSTISQ
jgi:hypothetical protein